MCGSEEAPTEGKAAAVQEKQDRRGLPVTLDTKFHSHHQCMTA